MPNFFVCSYTCQAKAYCDALFFESLNYMTYENKVIKIIDNSQDLNYLGRLNSIKEHFANLKNNCQIEHLDVPFEPKISLFNRAVHGSLKILQEQFLQSDCTHFVTIESDVIAPPNLLELFCEVLDKGADMIGGLYYNYTIHTKEDYENDDFVFSGGELTGCTCFSRKILEKIKFRQGDDLGCFPDAYFSLDAAANGFKLGRYRKIKCNHLDDGSGFRGHRDYIMKASSPKVSVIIPTYNRPELLERALQSVAAQTLEDFEIIVVNDCGVALEEILSKYDKIVYVKKAINSGSSASRNLALKIARGKYINFLDDDDYFYPNHLQTLVDALEQNEQYKVAYGNCLCATQKFMDGKWVTTHADLSYDIDFSIETLLVKNITPIHCVMFEYEILQKVGLLDECIKIFEDWDFWIKMGLQYPFYHVKTVTAEYSLREHGGIEQGNITSTRPDKDYTQIIYEKYAGIVKEKYPAVREAQEKVTQNNIKTAQNDKNWKILKEATKNITSALQTRNFMQAKEFYEQLKKQSLWANPDFAHVTQNLERQMTSIGL